MTEPTIDRETMGKLAKALAFICGGDHACTKAMKEAAENGKPADIKRARALFIKLKPGERQAALNMLQD